MLLLQLASFFPSPTVHTLRLRIHRLLPYPCEASRVAADGWAEYAYVYTALPPELSIDIALKVSIDYPPSNCCPSHLQSVHTGLFSEFDTSWSSSSAAARFLVTSREIPWNEAEMVDRNVLPSTKTTWYQSRFRNRHEARENSVGTHFWSIHACDSYMYSLILQVCPTRNRSAGRLSMAISSDRHLGFLTHPSLPSVLSAI